MIATDKALARLLERLVGLPRIGVDTEADSLHSYREKVCLIQVGLPDADELVDPLADVDLAPLLRAFGERELVLHGADFDLRMLYRVGLDAPGKVFDVMLAARLAGVRRFGYSTLVEEHFGVKLPKGSQKANWARRPLSDKMARYARNDTHYLLPLAELYEQRLIDLGRLEWLEQSCEQAVETARVVRERDPDREWRVRGSATLGPRASAVLRELWHWREREAEAIDRPPFHILSNEELVDAARRFDRGAPVSPRRMPGKRRSRFYDAAERGRELDRSEWPRKPKREPRASRPRFDGKQLSAHKQRRDRAARELGIDPSLIAPRAALERIAADREAGLDELLPWQRALLDG